MYSDSAHRNLGLTLLIQPFFLLEMVNFTFKIDLACLRVNSLEEARRHAKTRDISSADGIREITSQIWNPLTLVDRGGGDLCIGKYPLSDSTNYVKVAISSRYTIKGNIVKIYFVTSGGKKSEPVIPPLNHPTFNCLLYPLRLINGVVPSHLWIITGDRHYQSNWYDLSTYDANKPLPANAFRVARHDRAFFGEILQIYDKSDIRVGVKLHPQSPHLGPSIKKRKTRRKKWAHWFQKSLDNIYPDIHKINTPNKSQSNTRAQSST